MVVNTSNVTATAVSNSSMVSEWWMIIGLFSIFLLLGFLAWIFITPIGKESFRRWLNAKKYKKGGFTNAIVFTKDGLAKELFKSNSDGCFKYDEKSYTRVPHLAVPYKGIPTLFYIEGLSTPLDVYGTRDRDNMLSCNELDVVMHQNMSFDFKEWFNKNKMYFLLGLAVIAIALVVSVYLNYTIFEWVRDQAPAISDNVNEMVRSKVTG